jgi:hypothetical protein
MGVPKLGMGGWMLKPVVDWTGDGVGLKDGMG